MSQENVETVRGLFLAFNRRDIPALLGMLDPDVERLPIMAVLERRSYRGHEGVKQWIEHLDDYWELFEVDAEDLRDLGDRVLPLVALAGSRPCQRWHGPLGPGGRMGFLETALSCSSTNGCGGAPPASTFQWEVRARIYVPRRTGRSLEALHERVGRPRARRAATRRRRCRPLSLASCAQCDDSC